MLPPYIQRQKQAKLRAPIEQTKMRAPIEQPGLEQARLRAPTEQSGLEQARLRAPTEQSGPVQSEQGQPNRLAEILGRIQTGTQDQNTAISQPKENNSMSSLLSIIKMLIQSGQLRG